MKPLSRNALAAALVLTVGFGAAGTTQASVLATSILELTNFQFSSGGTPITNINTNNPYISIAAGNNFGNNTATLESVAGAAFNNTAPILLGPQGGQFDLLSRCQGDCPTALAENDFTTIPYPVVATYARADNRLQGAAISLDTNNDGNVDVPAGVTASTRSDVSLLLADEGFAQSNTGTNTTFDFFVVGGPITIDIDFDYRAIVYAFVDSTAVAPSTATAGVGWNMNITRVDTGVNVFSWVPTQLNLSASRSDAATGIQTINNVGSLSNTVTLNSGIRYQLTINHFSQSEARHSVPEPGSLALLGVGLLALGGAAVRRRQRLSA